MKLYSTQAAWDWFRFLNKKRPTRQANSSSKLTRTSHIIMLCHTTSRQFHRVGQVSVRMTGAEQKKSFVDETVLKFRSCFIARRERRFT